jgi:uncharacterized protein (TIRG00374 family)
MKKISNFFSKNKTSIILIVLVGVLIYLFIPSKETIEQTIDEIKGADPFWVILATIFFFVTIPLNAFQLRVVSDIKVKFWLTYKVQMAYLFIGKLLPSSISAFVVNSFYLHKIGHSPAQTASVIAIKAVSSSIAFLILGLVAIVLGLSNLKGLNLNSEINTSSLDLGPLILVIVVAGISLFWVLLKMQKTREFINKTIGNFWGQFKTYKNRPWDVVLAIAYSLILTTLQMLTLWASAIALNMDVNFTQIFIVFTLGNTAAMLVPTPGGVGAAEAGLYAGFTLLGFPSSLSLAVVTLYRVITFWVPIIPGFIFFINLRKDLLSDFTINKNMFKRSKSTNAATA